MKNLEMSIEEFTEMYIRPAVKELARKYLAGEPLTEFEKSVVNEALRKRGRNSR